MTDVIESVSSETDLQEQLQSYFKMHDWIALREQSPVGVGSQSNVRADLIVNHDTYGWFGVETKYFNSDGGAKVADAHHQIVSKYRSRKYINHRINLWVICPYFSGSGDDSDKWHTQRANWRQSYTREFFCRHGIGFLNPHRDSLLLDFTYSDAEKKVPVDTDRETRHHRNVDIEKIRTSVERKIKKYGY